MKTTEDLIRELAYVLDCHESDRHMTQYEARRWSLLMAVLESLAKEKPNAT